MLVLLQITGNVSGKGETRYNRHHTKVRRGTHEILIQRENKFCSGDRVKVCKSGANSGQGPPIRIDI